MMCTTAGIPSFVHSTATLRPNDTYTEHLPSAHAPVWSWSPVVVAV